MDFSPWDRAKSFQLHEAACLIAGVMPSSKRLPDREELPSNALQYYKSLATAYVLWVTHHDQPDDPNYPKAEMLKGEPQIGSDEPTLSVSIDKLAGEFVSREELHRWVKATGITSAYAFAPWSRPTTPSPAPVVAESASGGESTEQRQARRYQACIDAGLTMPNDDYSHLPRGIGALARVEGISRQSFSEDLKAHINRKNGR